MRERLRRDLTAALKSRDTAAVAALRSAIAAIDNAGAPQAAQPVGGTTSEHVAGASVGLGSAEVARRQLSTADIEAIMRREIDDRRAAAGEYVELGRPDQAERLEAEASVLAGYLG